MRSPEHIETGRLVLRRPRQDDAESVFRRYASDPEVTRLLAWPTHTDVDASRAFIATSDAHWEKWSAGPLLILSRSSGMLLGSTGLTFHGPDLVETGYLLTRDSWGKGYATEALGAVLDLCQAIGLRSVQAHCHVSHTASAHVLEKCGFTRQRLAPRYMVLPNLGSPEPSDVYVYAIDLGGGARPRVHIMRTERLGFSLWSPSDEHLAALLWGDPRVTALIDARGRLTDGQIRERLEAEIRTHEASLVQYWPLFLLTNGEFAGCCGLRPYKPEENLLELGVHLRPAMQGTGLATEACCAAIRCAFERRGARGLFAGHHPENAASRRLLQRLGFRYTRDELYPPTGLRHPSYLLMAGDESSGAPQAFG